MPSTSKSSPTSRRRPKHDPEHSAAEILEAAERFLRERPFRELSVDEVMRRTGLKRPAFYVHFRDRHDLVLRVIERLRGELFESAHRWLDGNDPANDVRRAMEGQIEVFRRHGPVLRALADAARTDEGVERAYNGIVDELVKATARHIRAEQARGRIGALPDVDETARALTLLDERYLTETFGRNPKADPEVAAQVLLNIWVSTLYGQRD